MRIMDPDQLARATYLILLLTFIGSYFLVANRDRMGEMARHAALWGLIFLGTIAAIGLWSDIRNDVAPRQSYVEEGVIEVPRGMNGHYNLMLDVNGHPVRFLVDTGATDVVLSREDAMKAGIDLGLLNYTGFAQTANGTVRTARVRLDEMELGDVVDRGVRASVTEGDLGISLLGMSYLERFDRVSIEGGRLVLER